MSEGSGERDGGGLRRIFRRRAGGAVDSAGSTDSSQVEPSQAENRQADEEASSPATLDEMRRDVAALWLAFTQHERVLGEIRGELARLGGRAIAAPGEPDRAPGEPAPPLAPGTGFPSPAPGDYAPASGGSPVPPAPRPVERPGAPPRAAQAAAPLSDVVSDQLANLDDVLAAIEHATRSLEQAHSAELEPAEHEGAESPDDTRDDT